MAKTFSRVWQECQTLTRIECRVFMLYHARMPDSLAECVAETALQLYVADVLKFDKVTDSNGILLILNHYEERLRDYARQCQANLDHGPAGPVFPICRLGIFDGRYVTLSGETVALDLETGETVPYPRNDLRVVTYNLATLMLKRWAPGHTVAAPPQSGDPDGPAPAPVADGAAPPPAGE